MKKLHLLLICLLISLSVISQNIPSFLPTGNLIAWYPFNGNPNDATGNGNNPNYISATLTSDRYGNLNQAYSFNGFNSQYISLTNVNLPMASYSRTISMWLYPTGIVNSGWTLTAFSYGSQSTSHSQMVGLYNGLVRYLGWADDFDVSYAYSFNQWINVTVTFNGSYAKTYINGVYMGTQFKSSWYTTGSAYFFGTRPDALNSYWNGKIDDVAIWGRVLSAAEVQQVYIGCQVSITGHPNYINTTYGSSALFRVATSNPSANNYQWQIDKGTGFQNIVNTNQYTGINNDTLIVSGLNMQNNGSKLRCIVTSGSCSVTSNYAILTVTNLPPKIIPFYIPTTNLIAWYPFNGNAIDESGNGNNGAKIKASLSTDRRGTLKRAYSFNGFNNEYISCINANLPMGKSKRTISMWLRPDTIVNSTQTMTALSYGQQSSGNANMVGLFNGKIRYIGWGDDVDANYPYLTNQWINITTTFDGLIAKIYVNGNLLDSATKALWNTNGLQYYFGTRADTINAFFNGKIDDIAIWSRVLTDSEIQQVYIGCQFTVTSQPVALFSSYGSSAKFTISTTSTYTNFQWQINPGSGFQNLISTSQFSGINNDTLTVSGLNLSNNNKAFRCLINSEMCNDTSHDVSLIVTGMPPKIIPAFIPTDSLVAWYPFNGNAIDESGNGNNATFNNATLTTNKQGSVNSAYSFNGFNDEFISCVNMNLPMGKSKRTISMWLNPSGIVNSSQTLTALSYGEPTNGKANMIGLLNGTVRYMGWLDDVETAYPYSFNQWINVITTFDSLNVKIYTNGILQVSTTKTNWNTTGWQYYFGARADTGDAFFNGKIDDIAIWGRILSDYEILQVYNGYCLDSITSNPTDVVSNYGGSVQFKIASSNPNSNFRWQTDLGSGFQNINNTSQYSGIANDTLTVSGLNNINNNQKFRCITFSGSCFDTSDVATLNVNSIPPVIIPEYLPTNNLVAWYPFNGNAIDESGNGNNATNIKASLSVDRNSNSNSAYLFNGFNNQYISCLNNNLPMGKSKRTISMWLNPAGIVNTTETLTAFSYGQPATDKANMVGLFNGTVRYMGWGDETDANYPFVNNQWINVTTTFDSMNVKIYVNGSLVGSGTKSAWNTSGWQYYFGTRADAANSFFNGRIDDIAIWGRVLSFPEIMKVYTGCVLSITSQPKSDSSSVGNSAQFIIAASDSACNRQWQSNEGTGFHNIINGGQYSGLNTDTLTINRLNLFNNNQTFRCIISKGICADTSVSALLSVKNNNIIPVYIPSGNLLAWYPFNSNANDESGNGNDPVVIKAGLTSDRNSILNKAYAFNGFNKQYILSHNQTLPKGNSSRTISIWLYPTGVVDSSQTLTAFSFGSQEISKSNMVGMFNNSIRYLGLLDDLEVTYNYSLNQWLNIITTFDGTSAKIYANGSLIGSGNKSNWNTFASGFLCIGTRPDTLNGFFNGKIDDIAVWGRVLTFNEIHSVYLGPTGLKNEASENNFSLYPNPSHTSINIKGDFKSQPTEYIIFDQIGRLIQFGEINESSNTISIEGLQQGLYFIKLNNQGNSFIKFIKN